LILFGVHTAPYVIGRGVASALKLRNCWKSEHFIIYSASFDPPPPAIRQIAVEFKEITAIAEALEDLESQELYQVNKQQMENLPPVEYRATVENVVASFTAGLQALKDCGSRDSSEPSEAQVKLAGARLCTHLTFDEILEKIVGGIEKAGYSKAKDDAKNEHIG